MDIRSGKLSLHFFHRLCLSPACAGEVNQSGTHRITPKQSESNQAPRGSPASRPTGCGSDQRRATEPAKKRGEKILFLCGTPRPLRLRVMFPVPHFKSCRGEAMPKADQ